MGECTCTAVIIMGECMCIAVIIMGECTCTAVIIMGDFSCHSGEYEDGCLLGCRAVWPGFREAFCFHNQYYEILMMEVVSTCEMSVNFCHTTRYNIP
jgi:hypothetical protein